MSDDDDVLALGKWADNGRMIADAHRLGYVGDRVLDLTYQLGTFWKHHRPDDLVTNDLDVDVDADHHVDAAGDYPPEWTASFDTVVWDPPYKNSGTAPASDARYGVTDYVPHTERASLLVAGAVNAVRAVKPGGYLLVKCQDQVAGGAVRWQTYEELVPAMRDVPVRLVDEFVFRSGRPQPRGRRQLHARRNYSKLMVFRRLTDRQLTRWRNERAMTLGERIGDVPRTRPGTAELWEEGRLAKAGLVTVRGFDRIEGDDGEVTVGALLFAALAERFPDRTPPIVVEVDENETIDMVDVAELRMLRDAIDKRLSLEDW